jgi:hypothetical protein
MSIPSAASCCVLELWDMMLLGVFYLEEMVVKIITYISF